ncbi:MAG TPA: hypothetical protein VJO16_21570 [Candidatus Acidoferrum sp.]|nr:hypothetical protein [Candidatus Acidoferrum sp.]
MHFAIHKRASSVRPPKSLVARGGLARTFGGLAGFLVITFLGVGSLILQDAFANPIHAGAPAVFAAAFMITLAAVLLFFLLKPPKRPRATSHERSAGFAVPAARPAPEQVPSAVRTKGLRNDLSYQRTYVDHSCIARKLALGLKRVELPGNSALRE